jgi:hypothetical protein
MGLGFQTRASLRRKSAFGLLCTVISPEEIAAAIFGCASGTPLEPLASRTQLDNGRGCAFTLHPTAESVYMDLDGESVTVSAKTSNVGPGYHAFLVSILDSVQATLGLRWEWGEEDDETLYARHRDFEALQSEMAKHFKAVAAVVSDQIAERGLSGMMLSMPMDSGIQTFENEILTPLGPITLAELRRWATLEGPELRHAATNYFPWWELEFGGGFYRGLALHSMWTAMRWAKPVDDAECRDIERTLAWCEEAQRLRADPPVSTSAVSDLRALLESPQAPEFPLEKGIGYRRRHNRVQLTGGWQLWVQGSLEETLEDDNTTVVLWNNVLTIRASSVSARPEGESVALQLEESVIETEREFGTTADGDGFTLQVKARKRSADAEHICVLTFWMTDAGMRGLAENMAETLSHRDEFK